MGLKIKQNTTLNTDTRHRVDWPSVGDKSSHPLFAMIRLIGNSDSRRSDVLFPFIYNIVYFLYISSFLFPPPHFQMFALFHLNTALQSFYMLCLCHLYVFRGE